MYLIYSSTDSSSTRRNFSSFLRSFARAAKYTVNEGMSTIEKQPTTAAKAHRNSVAASISKTSMLENASLTVNTFTDG